MKRGDVRDDGMVLATVSTNWWVTPERFLEIKRNACERAKAYVASMKTDNPEAYAKHQNRRREYNSKNSALISAKSKDYHAKNRVVKNRKSREYYEKNSEKFCQYQRSSMAENPQIRWEYCARERARYQGGVPAAGYSGEERFEMQFLYLLSNTISMATGIRHHVDHIIPLAKGGMHHHNNLRIIDGVRNMAKNTKLILDYTGKEYGQLPTVVEKTFKTPEAQIIELC